MVYVDAAPVIGQIKPDFDDDELSVPSTDELREEEDLDGLSDHHLAELQSRSPRTRTSLCQDPDRRGQRAGVAPLGLGEPRPLGGWPDHLERPHT